MQLFSHFKKHSAGIFTLAACALMAGGLVTSPSFAAGDTPPDHRVTICHATGSTTNPFVVITPAKAGVVKGHEGAGHQDAEDIIPPFDWNGQSFPGQNWDAQGQATFNAGCVVTVVTSPPPTTPGVPTTPVQPTTPVEPSGAAVAAPLGAAKAAPPQEVSIAADTAADTAAADEGADYVVSAALFGSGALLIVWVLLTLYAHRTRGQHA
ncbi:hypothetical protein [Sinomonas mesophila]|uniref:hypothetical protein n=1 Tax=Sinomonas mesophila TaxID=1531955 RepID=UPI0009878033|nr:hypothetical protein [Sinomonas mesophila]